jgi:hypothetical protein
LQVKVVEIPYKRPDEFHLYCFGDIHCGTKHCAEAEVDKLIARIKADPKAMWIDMGDKGEFITPGDPRWDVGALADWLRKDEDEDNIPELQTEWYADKFEPIAPKSVGLLEGNHEDAIRTHSHVDVHKNICKRLGVDSLGYSCFVKFKFVRGDSERHEWTGFFTHGSGSAITRGSKMNRLQRMMDSFDADFYAMGHMHDVITTPKPYITVDDANKVKEKVRWGAVTGCFFTAYTQGVRASYAEKKGYPPTQIGGVVFTIIPDKNIIKLEG